jgi:hypothetical protein
MTGEPRAPLPAEVRQRLGCLLRERRPRSRGERRRIRSTSVGMTVQSIKLITQL